ncbi:MAG: heme exporter protein CcmD [Burkholderiales bacterium]|nr:heme exporter protein CcmD [Burkholderiales bacterium]
MRDDHALYLAATYGLAFVLFVLEALLTVRRHRQALRSTEDDA